MTFARWISSQVIFFLVMSKTSAIDLGYQSICSINNSDWHLHDFDSEDYTGSMLSGSDIVISATSIEIVIDYPVEHPTVRKQKKYILNVIHKYFHKIDHHLIINLFTLDSYI